MIVYIIVLSAAGVVIALLSIIAYIAIQDSNRQARLKDTALRAKGAAQDAKAWLEAENGRLQRENAELNARNTALVEAMEARPTQPKRTVRKNTQVTES